MEVSPLLESPTDVDTGLCPCLIIILSSVFTFTKPGVTMKRKTLVNLVTDQNKCAWNSNQEHLEMYVKQCHKQAYIKRERLHHNHLKGGLMPINQVSLCKAFVRELMGGEKQGLVLTSSSSRRRFHRWIFKKTLTCSNQNLKYFIDPWGRTIIIIIIPIYIFNITIIMVIKMKYKQEQHKQNQNISNVHSTKIYPYIQCNK